MKVHANAPLGPKGRLTVVLRVLEQGWSLTEAAEAAGVSERTCSKWVARYRAEGQLVRSIGLFQLSLFGIGATIGTGIFIVLTQAVPVAGPAVIWSFVFAGSSLV